MICTLFLKGGNAVKQISLVPVWGAKMYATFRPEFGANNSEGALSTFTVVGLNFVCESGTNFGVTDQAIRLFIVGANLAMRWMLLFRIAVAIAMATTVEMDI